MVFRVVQCGEIGPVVFDLGAVGHVETDRTEDLLDALPGADHRVDAARAASPAGQGDVDGLGRQALVQHGLGQFGPPRVQQRLDLLLGLVDLRAARALFLALQGCEALEQRSQRPLLAQEGGFFVFQRGGIPGLGEAFTGLGNQFVER